MNYNFPFTITGSTSRSTAVTKDLHLSKGRIVHASVYFPEGANDVTHVQFEHHGSQILPANPDGDYCADLYLIEFPDCVPLTEPPYVLKARGWKTTATDVMVYINITVVPFPELTKMYPPAS